MTSRTHLFASVAFVAYAALGLLAGCSSTSIPVQRIVSAESAVRGAQEAGAEREPSAQLHLRLAQDQVATARKLITDGDNQRAAWVLLRAEADADLANSMAREAATKIEAQHAMDQVRSARESFQQGTPPQTQPPPAPMPSNEKGS